MSVIDHIYEYSNYIKKNPYVYSIQKNGIETFLSYIRQNYGQEELDHLHLDIIDKFLIYWLPKSKKYLSFVEAYHLVYTLQDIYYYVLNAGQGQKDKEDITDQKDRPAILEIYGEECMRIYKVREMLARITEDPILRTNPTVIDLMAYRKKVKNSEKQMLPWVYEQGIFQITDIKDNGQVVIKKLFAEKTLKIILEDPVYRYTKVGDIFHGRLRKRPFYLYWELDDIKSYYLPKAICYL